jgi:hypothetical protein
MGTHDLVFRLLTFDCKQLSAFWGAGTEKKVYSTTVCLKRVGTTYFYGPEKKIKGALGWTNLVYFPYPLFEKGFGQLFFHLASVQDFCKVNYLRYHATYKMTKPFERGLEWIPGKLLRGDYIVWGVWSRNNSQGRLI